MSERGKQRRKILKTAEKKETPKKVAKKLGLDLDLVRKTLRRARERDS